MLSGQRKAALVRQHQSGQRVDRDLADHKSTPSIANYEEEIKYDTR